MRLRRILLEEMVERLPERLSGPLSRLCAMLICALTFIVGGRAGNRLAASEWSRLNWTPSQPFRSNAPARASRDQGEGGAFNRGEALAGASRWF